MHPSEQRKGFPLFASVYSPLWDVCASRPHVFFLGASRRCLALRHGAERGLSAYPCRVTALHPLGGEPRGEVQVTKRACVGVTKAAKLSTQSLLALSGDGGRGSGPGFRFAQVGRFTAVMAWRGGGAMYFITTLGEQVCSSRPGPELLSLIQRIGQDERTAPSFVVMGTATQAYAARESCGGGRARGKAGRWVHAEWWLRRVRARGFRHSFLSK